eukprot:gene15825-33378_t
MLDSLVRVSRRDDKSHFVKVSPTHDSRPNQTGTAPFPRTEESLTYQGINTSGTLAPIGYISAISGTLSLSFQSSFHLSLTVLVRYRSPTNI